MRGLSPEKIDTPTQRKEAISVRCDGLDPQSMEVGYYSHSTKLWINSRLDIDVWNNVGRGEKRMLWCLTTTRQPQKRKRDSTQGSGEDSQGQSSKGVWTEASRATQRQVDVQTVGGNARVYMLRCSPT